MLLKHHPCPLDHYQCVRRTVEPAQRAVPRTIVQPFVAQKIAKYFTHRTSTLQGYTICFKKRLGLKKPQTMVNGNLTGAPMLSSKERKRILSARSIGPKVVSWLEQAGYTNLADFAHETPENISFRVEIATGIRRNQNALNAYAHLIALAKENSIDNN